MYRALVLVIVLRMVWLWLVVDETKSVTAES